GRRPRRPRLRGTVVKEGRRLRLAQADRLGRRKRRRAVSAPGRSSARLYSGFMLGNRRFWPRAMALAALALAASGAHAQTVDDIVRAYLEARGGAARARAGQGPRVRGDQDGGE